MSNIDIKGPQLPESVASAEFRSWTVALGEPVEMNQVIAHVESEKVSFDIQAPADGKITEFYAQPGDTILSEQILASFSIEPATPTAGKAEKADKANSTKADPAQASAASARAKSAPAPQPASAAQEQGLDLKGQPVVKSFSGRETTPTATRTAELRAPTHQRQELQNENDHSIAAKSLNLGPKARRLVLEHGVSSDEVEGYLKQKLPPRAIANDIKLNQIKSSVESRRTRVPMTNIRKHIAQRLLESKNSTAMLTTFNEVDLQKIVNIRKAYGEAFQKKHGIRLGFMSFFVKAVTEAMKEYPIISACIEGDDIIYSNATDISIAVSTERGLVTPVVRGTDNMSLADIERAIANFAEKANANKLTIDDMTGGNFTITNGGVFGSLFSTPIINPPQSAILGMHGIKKRPIVENDQIVIRPMMYIALSYDHRLIDGKDSVRFLYKVKELLEDPTQMLLDL